MYTEIEVSHAACKDYFGRDPPRLCSARFVDLGEGYDSLIELPGVSGTGIEVLKKSQKFRVLWHGRTELTEVPGGNKNCFTRTPGIVARGIHNS